MTSSTLVRGGAVYILPVDQPPPDRDALQAVVDGLKAIPAEDMTDDQLEALLDAEDRLAPAGDLTDTSQWQEIGYTTEDTLTFAPAPDGTASDEPISTRLFCGSLQISFQMTPEVRAFIDSLPVTEYEGPVGDYGQPVTLLDTTGLVGVHDPAACEGHGCPVHHPSSHHMANWPAHFRDDKYRVERICRHNTGHPDPDDTAHAAREAAGVTWVSPEAVAEYSEKRARHGCCGCCVVLDAGTFTLDVADLPEGAR